MARAEDRIVLEDGSWFDRDKCTEFRLNEPSSRQNERTLLKTHRGAWVIETHETEGPETYKRVTTQEAVQDLLLAGRNIPRELVTTLAELEI